MYRKRNEKGMKLVHYKKLNRKESNNGGIEEQKGMIYKKQRSKW